MFDMATECGAAINIENRQGLTPLTTAAYLARMDMFFHIARDFYSIKSNQGVLGSYALTAYTTFLFMFD